MDELDKKVANEPKKLTIVVSKTNDFSIKIKAQIKKLVWDQVEPERKAWKSWAYIYNEWERPNETFVTYIIWKQLLDTLTRLKWIDSKWLHIHENVNTEWSVICWPAKLESIEDTESVIKKWAWLVWALLVSPEKWDINNFFNEKDPNWIENTIRDAWVNVELIREYEVEKKPKTNTVIPSSIWKPKNRKNFHNTNHTWWRWRKKQ